MAGQQLRWAIWGSEAVVESMHGLQAALKQWEKVGAAEEPDLNEMDETQEQFLDALAQLNDELGRDPAQNDPSEKQLQPAKLTADYEREIQIPNSDLVNAISHLVDTGNALEGDKYQLPKMTRAITGLIHALRQVGVVQ